MYSIVVSPLTWHFCQALPGDPTLDTQHVIPALLRTFLDLVSRLAVFVGYPTKVWTLSQVAIDPLNDKCASVQLGLHCEMLVFPQCYVLNVLQLQP